MSFQPEVEQSEFNQSIDVLYKIANIRNIICRQILDNDILNMYNSLKVYYFLIEPIFTPTEITTHNKYFNDSRKAYYELKKIFALKQNKINYELIETLDNWYREMNKTSQLHGLLMIKKRDARYALSSK